MEVINKIKKSVSNLYKSNLKDLFIFNSNRFAEHSLILDNLLFDYSKNYINKDILNNFIEAVEQINFKQQIEDMFSGELTNFTEKRAVLHVALRNKNIKPVMVKDKDYYNDIWNTFNRYCDFAEQIKNGEITSSSKEKFTDIVNIGIGGSYLPILASYEALQEYKDKSINLHFVSNVDSASLENVIKKVNPKTTLFVIASKTFTTTETMLNAISAKKWLIENIGSECIENHFVAVSTNIKSATEFGIKEENIFGFWDFIGGRFSLWSAISLPLVIAIGKNNFLQMLKGAELADNHFKEAPLDKNIPFIMAVLSVIYRNCLNMASEAVIPYCENLSKFPLYLQQVVMESNGKSVSKNGEPIDYQTSPVVFGEVGTNAQHSFFQLLHQGTDIIPVDFIGFVNSANGKNKDHQDMLIANMIAQSEALMIGKSKEEVLVELQHQKNTVSEIHKIINHKIFKGNRPSSMLFFNKLNPKNLGMLYALYEHKVFSLGLIWQINSFDQYGVELGKQLATKILLEIQGKEYQEHDSSTKSLIEYYKNNTNN